MKHSGESNNRAINIKFRRRGNIKGTIGTESTTIKIEIKLSPELEAAERKEAITERLKLNADAGVIENVWERD